MIKPGMFAWLFSTQYPYRIIKTMTTDNPYSSQVAELERLITQAQTLLTDPEMRELAELDLQSLNEQKTMLLSAAEQYASADSDDNAPLQTETAKAIIEVRGGAGGDEAKIWGNDLLRMYLRFIENKGLKVEAIDEDVLKISGRTELTIPALLDERGNEVKPAETVILYPYELFKYETGVHRVQRVPVTESQGRVHTSTASVAVLPEIPAKAIIIRDDDLSWHFTRAGGAGGQNVNKVNSAVELTHIPTGIVVKARQERTQSQNKMIALELLRSRMWEIQEEERITQLGQARSAIGRNMRAEKIRTYNYPQNRVTDHRINESWYSLDRIIEGELEQVFGLVRAQLANNA